MIFFQYVHQDNGHDYPVDAHTLFFCFFGIPGGTNHRSENLSILLYTIGTRIELGFPLTETTIICHFKSSRYFWSLLLQKYIVFAFLCRFRYQNQYFFNSLILGKSIFPPKEFSNIGQNNYILLFLKV